jgi:hypothetical protein
MIAAASGLGIGVCRFSKPLRVVGVLAMPDAGLYSMGRVESISMVPLGDGVQRLLVPGVAVGVIIDRCCVSDGVEVTC